MAAGYYWKGVKTKGIYQAMSGFIPTALQDASGNPLQKAFYNGEWVIACNADGSVARATATSGPTIYDAYVQPSIWEQTQANAGWGLFIWGVDYWGG